MVIGAGRLGALGGINKECWSIAGMEIIDLIYWRVFVKGLGEPMTAYVLFPYTFFGMLTKF